MAPPDATAARLRELRHDLDNAAGEAFLPPGWQRLVSALPALVAVAEAAADFVERSADEAEPDWTELVAALRALGESAVREEPR